MLLYKSGFTYRREIMETIATSDTNQSDSRPCFLDRNQLTAVSLMSKTNPEYTRGVCSMIGLKHEFELWDRLREDADYYGTYSVKKVEEREAAWRPIQDRAEAALVGLET